MIASWWRARRDRPTRTARILAYLAAHPDSPGIEVWEGTRMSVWRVYATLALLEEDGVLTSRHAEEVSPGLRRRRYSLANAPKEPTP